MQQLSNGYNLKATADTFASQSRYTLGVERSLSGPDGHFKLPHLWPPKLPQAGRLKL
jgi:hypothetical protein